MLYNLMQQRKIIQVDHLLDPWSLSLSKHSPQRLRLVAIKDTQNNMLQVEGQTKFKEMK